MQKKILFIPILAGLLFGQVLAENSDSPVSVMNTIRFGYNDNLYRNTNDKKSTYVSDTVDLSFRASLSDRTDFMAKTRFDLLTDSGGSEIYPNLYAMLNHAASPRLLLRLSDYYRSGEKSGTGNLNQNERYNYFYNQTRLNADYILNPKNRIAVSGDYAIKRHDNAADTLDSTVIGADVAWSRELVPQRTRSTISLRQQMVEYDNRDSSYNSTDISAELRHTFNPQWQGSLLVGANHVRPDFPAPAKNDAKLNPMVNVGLVYTPSPRTRFNADFMHRYEESDDNGYGGQTKSEFRFGVQQDVTAKIIAKASARFAHSEYDKDDDEAAGTTQTDEDRMDLEFKLAYKINRTNFLELNLRHSEKTRDPGDDWEQNMIDVGWRVELM
jgi:hypothetical protein